MGPTNGLSALLVALAHPYRRISLYYLREHERASVETLAECVSGWLSAGPGPGTGSDPGEFQRARLRLHHVHLPKLAAVGLVQYDDENRMVTATTESPVVDDLLTATLREDAAETPADTDALLAEGDDPDA